MTTAVRLEGLRKIYANGTEALKGIDLKVEAGDFFALLGPNGAGKSTAIGILASLVRKSSGRVEVFGHDLDRDPQAVKRCIGLVPQEFNFNQWEPVEEIVINQAGYYGIPRRVATGKARKVLQTLDLWSRRRVQARSLSGGLKRRLMIARALVHEPPLMILDEPTAGVDIEIRRSMWAFMHKRVFDLVKDFGTSESPKSTRSSTTHWCPGRPGHPAFRHNIASSLRLHTGLPYDWTPRSDAPLGSPLAPSARRVSRVASRLPGTTRLRFALHGGQREINRAGTTIILTTHYLEEAENLCRSIAIIDDGRIAESSTMRALLQRLHRQAFLLTLKKPLERLPEGAPVELGLHDEHTLEAVLGQDQTLNQLFGWLDRQGIEVLSMRNKQNRLEQFFMDRVQKRREAAA